MSSNPMGALLQHDVLAHVVFVQLLQQRGRLARLHAHGRVLPGRDGQVQIAGFPSALAGSALSREPHARAGLHARGNLHLQARDLGDGALAAASGAGFADGALSLAARTRRAEDAAHEDLARPSALRAGLRPAAGARAAALAFGAPHRPVDGDLPLGAEHRVAQVHLDGCLDVFTRNALRRRAARPRAPAPAEQVLEHRAEVRGIESAAGEIFETAKVAAAETTSPRLPLE